MLLLSTDYSISSCIIIYLYIFKFKNAVVLKKKKALRIVYENNVSTLFARNQ